MNEEGIARTWRDPALLLKALPSMLLQAGGFVAPLLMTLALTFQTTRSFQLTWTWNLATWTDIFSRAYYWTTLLHTLVMAAICVALCLVIAMPIAYALATRLRAWQNHVKVLITFAFLTDMTLKTFGWALFLDKTGVANYLLGLLGIDTGGASILFTDWATMLGMVYNLLPFAIFTIYISVDAIDRSLILAAYDAGAGKFRTFWEVTLPLCRPGISAGAVLIFLLAVGVFLEPKVLGGGKSPMSAELIRQTFETRVNWPQGAALTLILMLVSVLVVLLFNRVYSLKRLGGVAR
jgi:ABC-type spermidine/putrescine transport system permease subunit I